jgi:hypothetical protein
VQISPTKLYLINSKSKLAWFLLRHSQKFCAPCTENIIMNLSSDFLLASAAKIMNAVQIMQRGQSHLHQLSVPKNATINSNLAKLFYRRQRAGQYMQGSCAFVGWRISLQMMSLRLHPVVVLYNMHMLSKVRLSTG